MKADYWRKGVATVLTAGLLATGAVAQDGAEGEVNIKDSAPAATSTPAETQAPAKPIKPQIVERDPFVNQLLTGNISTSTAGSRPATRNVRARPATNPITAAGTTAAAAPGAAASGAVGEEAPEPEIPAPEVTVNGIVSSGSGRQAIISTGVGTRMISPGMKLGDYRVSTIGPNYVTFNYGGKKDFKVVIDNEFAK